MVKHAQPRHSSFFILTTASRCLPSAANFSPNNGSSDSNSAVVILAVVLAVILAVALIALVIRYGQKMLGSSKNSEYGAAPQTYTSTTATITTTPSYPGASSFISSGRALSSDSQVESMATSKLSFKNSLKIGSGKFSAVYKINWNGREAAAKVFHPAEDNSFFWEKELFEGGLRHDGIVLFLNSDLCDMSIGIRRVILTEYHPFGSLYEFLSSRGKFGLAKNQCIVMATSIASGLAYLHSDGTDTDNEKRPVVPRSKGSRFDSAGSCLELIDKMESGNDSQSAHQRKVPMAHCDLKSRNVLVRQDLTCCISDFGMVMRWNSEQGVERKSTHSLRVSNEDVTWLFVLM